MMLVRWSRLKCDGLLNVYFFFIVWVVIIIIFDYSLGLFFSGSFVFVFVFSKGFGVSCFLGDGSVVFSYGCGVKDVGKWGCGRYVWVVDWCGEWGLDCFVEVLMKKSEGERWGGWNGGVVVLKWCVVVWVVFGGIGG